MCEPWSLTTSLCRGSVRQLLIATARKIRMTSKKNINLEKSLADLE